MRRLLIGLLVLLALLGALVVWLLGTTHGAQTMLDRISGRVEGLQIGSVERNVLGGLTLGDLSWRNATTEVSIRKATVDLSVWSTATGTPRLNAVSVEGLQVIHRSPPASGPGSPLALPALRIEALDVRQALIDIDGTQVLLDRVQGALRIGGAQIDITGLQLNGPQLSASGDLLLDLATAQPLRSGKLVARHVTTDGTVWDGTLDARSQSADASTLALALLTPLQAAVTGIVSHDLAALDLRLEAPVQDGAALGIDGDVAADLRVQGAADVWSPTGSLSIGAESAEIVAGSVRHAAGTLGIDGLRVAVRDRGELLLSGGVPLDDSQTWSLRAQTESLILPRGGPDPLTVNGSVGVDGARGLPVFTPDLRLSTPGLPAGRLGGQFSYADAGVTATALRLDLGRGTATIDGRLSFVEPAALKLRLAALDPSLFAPEWPGVIDGRLEWTGAWTADGATGTLVVSAVSGSLRGRTLSGRGSLLVDETTVSAGQLALDSGSARLRASAADGGRRLDVSLNAPDLDDLAPQLGGSLDLVWQRADGDRIDARGTSLRYQDVQIEALEIAATRGTGNDPTATARVEAQCVGIGTNALSNVTLDMQGRQSRFTLQLAARREQQQLDLGLEGGWDANGWRGRLESLEGIAGDVALRLREPAAFSADRARFEMDLACLTANTGSLCISARHAGGEGALDAQLEGLSLATLGALLPNADLPQLEGLVEGSAKLAWRDGQPTDGSIDIRSSRGLVLLPDRTDLDLGYRELSIVGQWQDGSGTITGGADLIPDGRIDVAAQISRDATGAFGYDATMDVLLRQLDGIEAFTTQIAQPEGEVRGQLRLRGGNVPRSISGALALTGFTAQVPELALRLREGVFVLAGVPGKLIVRGSVVSGDGTLAVDGRIDLSDPQPALLRITGTDVRVSNTPSLSVVASPDLTLALRDARWNLDGSIDVPRARINASRLEGGVDRSPDVVVIDAELPPDPRRPWRARVRVTLGDDVRLEGFGFDGSLQGRLDITQRQGAKAIANGEITLQGRYEAFGQRLTIKRGGLRFANSPLGEPTLDLRAERKVRNQTVALVVTGNASRPDARISGSGGMTDTEALSLLVTGRSLNRADAGDRNELSDAAVALSTVGSDLLTSSLRGRLGLDELGVSNDTEVDGEAFTLGKYLSPRLYVGYGIGLLTRGEVFTVRYLFTERVELEATTGSTTRASINYRIER
jgi:translocation and assembly module TamB